MFVFYHDLKRKVVEEWTAALICSYEVAMQDAPGNAVLGGSIQYKRRSLQTRRWSADEVESAQALENTYLPRGQQASVSQP